MDAFKAYDIRGIYNKDFDKDDVYKIGYFLPELLQAEKVLVGYDARLSSDEIFTSLAQGIIDKGADVYNLGFTTTPMVYFATASYNFPASVQITASHNAKEYNGLKISREGALPVGYETGLSELEKMIENKEIMKNEDVKGKIIKKNIKSNYVKFLKKFLHNISNLKISVDCSNGMAALIIKDILGNYANYIYDDIDCTFPHHAPNPLIEENVSDLKKEVKKNNSDLGIIFDGDGDRVMFVDEKGNFISPDLITAFMADYFLGNKHEKVLYDIRTSRSVSEYIIKKGGKPVMWKVGHSYAKRKLREINGIYGGELAGHYYFRDFFYCDSGILAAIIVLNVLSDYKKRGFKISQLISRIDKYSFSGEINYKIEDKREAMETLKNIFTKGKKVENIYDFDGYRIEFCDWWFNVRPSNTEPYLRLVIEAKNDKILEEKTEEIKSLLNEFL